MVNIQRSIVLMVLAGILSGPSMATPLQEGSLGTFSYAHCASVAVDRNGAIYVAASVHMSGEQSPLAKVYLWRSTDGGASWDAPQKLTDSPLDDVGAGLCITKDGVILVNYSTSIGWALGPEIENPQFKAWWGRVREMSLVEASSHVNFWMIRSEDGGETWLDPVELPANPLAGVRQLKDGNLFMFGQQVTSSLRQMIDGQRNNFLMCAAVSKDQGRAWEVTKVFPAVYGDGVIATSVHNTGFAQTASGEIAVLTQNSFEGDGTDLNQFELLEGYGTKWSRKRKIGEVSDFHIIAMESGDLLLSYTTPSRSTHLFARTSPDGKTWKDLEPIVTRDREIKPGFSTAEFRDGSFVTVWFEHDGTHNVRLQYCIWRP